MKLDVPNYILACQPQDVLRLKQVLEAMPVDAPPPVLMCTDDQKIGMYWDDKAVYIDLDIDPDGKISIFKKNRKTKVEEFHVLCDTEFTAAYFEAHVLAFIKQGDQ